MRRTLFVAVPAVAAALALAACGSSSYSNNSAPSTSSRSTASPQSSGASGAAVVKSTSNPSLGGAVLTNAQGMTLYALSAEAGGRFICTSSCLQVWHPLTVTGTAHPSGSVGSLGTIKRPDGATQVTFQGKPLYTFAQDARPGDVHGQGIKDVGTWAAVQVTAARSTASSRSQSTTSAPSSTGANGY